ncbi:acylphosphatase [Candidatus Margulisiibacteriota bacterium]
MLIRKHIIITGLVQGVCFRMYTQREAEYRGVTGWVKNNIDGKLEAVFEGEKDAVDRVVTWCRQGPPSAMVQDIEIREDRYTGEYIGFEIAF